MAKKTICIVVEEEKAEKIRELADKHHRSMSGEMRVAIDEYLRKEGAIE